MKILLALVMVVCMIGVASALPLGAIGEISSRYGDIAVPSSLSQDCQYLNELLVKRPFDIDVLNGLTITPFVSGKVYNSTFCDDMIMKSLTIGFEADINDSLVVGAERSRLDFGKGLYEETRSNGFARVTF